MTLVELLAALGIAGIIVSVGVTVFSGQTKRVRDGEALNEIARIQLAITAYSTHPGRPAGTLPPTLSALDLEPAALIDPWGRPYQYVSLAIDGEATAARLDGNRSPLNRDYDLYSFGRDGATAQSITDPLAGDDIMRAATGGFIGMAAEYSAIGGAGMAALSAGSGSAAADSSNPVGGLDPRR